MVALSQKVLRCKFFDQDVGQIQTIGEAIAYLDATLVQPVKSGTMMITQK